MTAVVDLSGTGFLNDPQIDGTRDDGTLEGIKRARLAAAGLVKVPFRERQTVQAGTNGFSHQFPENDDGSSSGIATNLAPGLNEAYVADWVFGPTVGVRWDAGYAASQKGLTDFSILVDKVAYPVPAMQIVPETTVASNTAEGAAGIYVVHDLPATWHYLEVTLPSPPIGSASAQVRLFGIVADRAAGYSEPPRLGIFEGFANVISTTQATPDVLDTILDASNAGGVSRPRGIRGILYYNTDPAPQTVYIEIKIAATWTAIWEVNLAAKGSAGSVAQFPPAHMGDLITANDFTTIGHYASKTNVITASVVKGY